MTAQRVSYTLAVKFEGTSKERQAPPTVAYVFDSTGKFLALAPVEKGQAHLQIPESIVGRTIKCLLGPPVKEQETVSISLLRRKGAYEQRLRVNPAMLSGDIRLAKAVWKYWFYCPCVVRGKVVVRVPLPNGTVQEMPVCHTRVTLCEVDRFPKIIFRLSVKHLYRLRDELLRALRDPLPPPPLALVPDLLAPAALSLHPEPPDTPVLLSGGSLSQRMATPQPNPPTLPQCVEPPPALPIGPDAQRRLQRVILAHTADELRQSLMAVCDLIYPHLWRWDWLSHYFHYVKHCFKTVMVDGNGEFETTIWYPCDGDKPDLYFKAEQWQGSAWKTIYKPSVRSHTYWNYECGSQVTLVVTDPSAIPCQPEPDVDLPTGISTWVMPFQVGRTEIWGTPPGSPTPLPSGAGWVKPDGTTDYGGVTDAPFGGYLGFTQGHSNNIPNSGIKYFRWSYRKVGETVLNHMQEPVVRHYVKQSPGELPSFPTYSLGHHTKGGNQFLYEFKPPSPPAATASDPSGTVTYWPTDNFFASDTYSAFLDTVRDASGAGQYEIWLEVFDDAGNPVSPGPGTFEFVVPTSVSSDGAVETRAATSGEEKTETIGGKMYIGFTFKLHVDNNVCTASIDAPNIQGVAIADKCGFLRYNKTDTKQVTLGFHAQHPNNMATFVFNVHRGADFLPGASAWDETGSSASGAYTGDGVGNFESDFDRSELLCGPIDPTDCCEEAAFAERVYVYAKATRGHADRISSYDSSATRAFALAPAKS